MGVGIIGANVHYGWGARAHLPALAAITEYELIGVATTRIETARETAAQFGIEHAYASPAELCANPDIDLVIVCVRVPSHYALTKLALEAGKNVFTEWPLGRTTDEARELRDLAAAQNVRSMVGLQARAAPAFVRLRELIQEGYVGDLQHVSLRQTLHGGGARGQSFAWAADVTQGATTLTIATAHVLDGVAASVAEIEQVSAVVATRMPTATIIETGETIPVTSPDTVMLAGTLAGGVPLSAAITSVPTVGTGLRLEVQGSNGVLTITSRGMSQIAELELRGAQSGARELELLELSRRSRWAPMELEGPSLNVGQMLRRMGDGIRMRRNMEPDFATAVRRHELVDAIQRASDSGQAQRIG
jgi:predicted dehydrogenase